ncbi:hypothetical protein ACQFYA_20900 [Promicromonospora sp. Marseille-Q5078]
MTDTHGIPTTAFGLAMYDGGQVWNADNWFFNMLMQLAWEPYRYFMSTAIGMLSFILDLTWVDWLLTPLKSLSMITQTLVAEFGLAPLMITLLAFVVGWWLLKGRYASGIVELIIGCVIAALAAGVLANPVGLIADKNDGLIYQSRDAGRDIATAIATDGKVTDSDSDVVSEGDTSTIVDTFIRVPHQIINYGDVIDGTRCEKTYDQALKENEDPTKVRETIGRCDKEYKEHSDHPDIPKAVNAFEMWTVWVTFGLFSLVVIIVFILSVLGAGWQSIKLVWSLILGMVPGGPRASLMRSFSNTAFALSMIAITYIFVAGWMRLQTAFFAATDDQAFLLRIRLFNLLLLCGAIALVLARHKIKKGWHRLGDRLAQLGASSANHTPSKLPAQIGDKAYQAWLFGRRNRAPKAPAEPTPLQSTPAPTPLPAPARQPLALEPGGKPALQIGAGNERGLPPGTSPRPAWRNGGPFTQPPGGGAAAQIAKAPSKALVLRSRLGTATKVAAHGGLIVASGGTGAAVTGAKVVAAGGKAGTLARTAGTAAAAAKAGTVTRGVTAAATTTKAATAKTAVARTTKAVDSVRTARAEAMRARIMATQMRPHKEGMVDQTTGVTYQRQVPAEGQENVEVYRPSGIDPDSVHELRARLKAAHMPPRQDG